MADLLGVTGLFGVAVVTLGLAWWRPTIGCILIVAFAVRASVALFHFYVAPLPDGTVDAVTFERVAWEWASGGFSSALSHYPGIDSYFYSWLMALLYAVTDRSLLLLQSVSVLLGVLGVYATWRLAFEVWSHRAACRAAWVMALFPTVVQYGALPMREVWVVLFLAMGLLAVVRWARWGGVRPVVAGVLAFGAASFFHGGMFVAVVAFLGLIAARLGRRWLLALSRRRLQLVATAGLVVVGGLTAFYALSGVAIDKLGTAGELFATDRWFLFFDSRVRGDAAYPGWTQPATAVDFLWAVPLRAVYFLFSPFPWDLSRPAHLVGFVDGLFYLGLAFLVWRNRAAIVRDPGARSVLLVLMALVFAFGVGTGNFGTGLRHRAKLVLGLIVLASPRVPCLVLKPRRRGGLP